MTASATKAASATSEAQRARVRAAMTRTVGEHGYLGSKVEEIAREAHVSYTTFYELYADKEACFRDAHATIATQLRDELASALERADAASATRACLETLLSFALEQRAPFKLIGDQALLAGSGAVAARDELLGGLASLLDRAWDRAPPRALVPDIPARLLVGGWVRALGMSARGADAQAERPLESLLVWAGAYESPASARCFARGLDDALRAASRAAAVQVEAAPMPRGRHGLSEGLVAKVQRERLIFGAAAAVQARGYERTSVAEIVAAAGVSREAFYEQFANKREAFAASLRLFLEASVGTLAGVYFAPSASWPERVWQTLGALLEFFATHASFARGALVEMYAVDAKGTLTDEFVMGFATFLEGGWQAASGRPPRAQSAAMIGAALEAIAIWVSGERAPQLQQLQQLLAYLLLAPALGAKATREFVLSRQEA